MVGCLAFHFLTGSCDTWKRKRQTRNYYRFFKKYPQIIALKYKQGRLQEWLFYIRLVCCRIGNMAGTLGFNDLLTCLSLSLKEMKCVSFQFIATPHFPPPLPSLRPSTGLCLLSVWTNEWTKGKTFWKSYWKTLKGKSFFFMTEVV